MLTMAFSNKLLTVVRNCVLSVAAAYLSITTISIFGSEYSKEDIDPIIVQILFTKSDIGLISRVIPQIRSDEEDNIYFLLNRNKETGKAVSKKEFIKIFGKKGEDKLPDYYHSTSRSTSDGSAYETIRKNPMDCSWVEVRKESELVGYKLVHSKGLTKQAISLNEKIIKTSVDACNTITVLEHVNSNLWIGTGYQGDHGNGPGQGVVIQSRKVGKFVKNLEMEDWTSAIRLDPYTGMAWVAASYVIHEVDANGNKKSTYRFYHDFDQVTGRPTIYISKKPVRTNPFALVARKLSDNNRMEFYNVAKDINQDLWPSFDLYNFYMCCYIDPSIYPEPLNRLVPVLLKEIEAQVVKDLSSERNLWLQNYHQIFWAQTLCRFNDPRVLTYFKSNRVIKGAEFGSMAGNCIEKLEKISG